MTIRPFTRAALAATLVFAGAAGLSKVRHFAASPLLALGLPSAAQAAEPDADTVRYGARGFDPSGMDRKARPGDSFFDYANGAWDTRTIIPPDQSRFGV